MTVSEYLGYIEKWTLTEIRRYLRIGMGLCYGQTCSKLVKSIVAKELGINPELLELAISRVLIRPIKMQVFANKAEEVYNNE